METPNHVLHMISFSSNTSNTRTCDGVVGNSAELPGAVASPHTLFFSPLHLRIQFFSTVAVKDPHWSIFFEADIASARVTVKLLDRKEENMVSRGGVHPSQKHAEEGTILSLSEGGFPSSVACWVSRTTANSETTDTETDHNNVVSASVTDNDDNTNSSSIRVPDVSGPSNSSTLPAHAVAPTQSISSLAPHKEYTLSIVVGNMKEKLSSVKEIYLQQIGVIHICLNDGGDSSSRDNPLQAWKIVCQGIRPSTMGRHCPFSSWIRQVYSPLQ